MLMFTYPSVTLMECPRGFGISNKFDFTFSSKDLNPQLSLLFYTQTSGFKVRLVSYYFWSISAGEVC